jgi:hypothetical protein
MLRFQKRVVVGFGGLAVMLFAGCGGDELELVPVVGKIMFQGKPVEKAEIAFIRDSTAGATKGPAPAAIGRTDENGAFTLITGSKEGAVPGSYKVTVQKSSRVYMKFPDPLPAEYTDQVDYMRKNNMIAYPLLPLQYADMNRTPLKYEVNADAEQNSFEIALEGEPPPEPKAPGPYRGADLGVP